MLLFDARFNATPAESAPVGTLPRIALVLFAVLVVGNALSTVLECGLGLCPDDPTGYEMLHRRT